MFVGLQNYINLFHDPVFWLAFKNNIIFVIATTILQTLIPMVLAVMLVKNSFLNTFFRVSYFVPNVISFIITGSLWAMIFEPNFGLLNTILQNLGLETWKQLWLADPKWAFPCIIFVSLWQSMGFYLVIFYAGLQGIPEEVYEAASVDGADSLRKFLFITVPLLRPVTTVVIIINVIGGFKVFDLYLGYDYWWTKSCHRSYGHLSLYSCFWKHRYWYSSYGLRCSHRDNDTDFLGFGQRGSTLGREADTLEY